MQVPWDSGQKARIEIIPMIDVIFFLLVFFMVLTGSMTVQRGLPVNLPTAATAQKDQREFQRHADTGWGVASQSGTGHLVRHPSAAESGLD